MASPGRSPGGGAAPALTFGSIGESFLLTERTRAFRFSDERRMQCLRAHPAVPIASTGPTRPGSWLRALLAGEGSGQRLFSSLDAIAQGDRPLLRMRTFR